MPLPANLSSAEATPLLCAGIIGYRALRRADMRPGCRLGLYGFGSSAHIAIQVARHLGCTVYVMTRDERHQQLARQLGAAWAGGADAAPPEKLDSAVLFAPVGHLVLPALEALDHGGTLALAGIYLTDIPTLNYERHLFHEKNLRSVTANTRRDGEELLRIAAEIPDPPADDLIPSRRCQPRAAAAQARRHPRVRGSPRRRPLSRSRHAPGFASLVRAASHDDGRGSEALEPALDGRLLARGRGRMRPRSYLVDARQVSGYKHST